MDIYEKLAILSDSAKYDVSCSSSGAESNFQKGMIGCNHQSGICHTFTEDGRCVSLLKVLFTNFCIYDCSYCVNRASNDLKRAAFSPRELAELTINFYKRNYIEGLFLSSGIIENEDKTMQLLIRALEILRFEYHFNGYVHLKLIPGASERLIEKACSLATRVSSNLELPSSKSLMLLAPNKTQKALMQPLKLARDITLEKSSTPIPMSTQLIIGATPESDFDILKLSSNLYQKALLKRVYYSAYIPANDDKNLPALSTVPPTAREHRLYQADWLLRFYGFSYGEILQRRKNLDLDFDPKMIWALDHMELFPVEVNHVDKEFLIRVPGIGIRGAHKILKARRFQPLNFEGLKKLGISLKRAKYFITIGGKFFGEKHYYPDQIKRTLLKPVKRGFHQPSLFESYYPAMNGEL
ncbi:MAG: putative DNA modification/repair radical SAM protein [Epsilonproteobacteria bacterium]|nr:putative DNA modification/repair radical SAM protein [Campylobacterota bacterium]